MSERAKWTAGGEIDGKHAFRHVTNITEQREYDVTGCSVYSGSERLEEDVESSGRCSGSAVAMFVTFHAKRRRSPPVQGNAPDAVNTNGNAGLDSRSCDDPNMATVGSVSLRK